MLLLPKPQPTGDERARRIDRGRVFGVVRGDDGVAAATNVACHETRNTDCERRSADALAVAAKDDDDDEDECSDAIADVDAHAGASTSGAGFGDDERNKDADKFGSRAPLPTSCTEMSAPGVRSAYGSDAPTEAATWGRQSKC